MARSKKFVWAAVLAAALVASADAQGPQFRQDITVQGVARGGASEHYLTFSGPVALPNVSLGAGTYVFRRPTANVLQVLSANRRPYAMVLTIATTRATAIDRYQIVFGAPMAPGSPRRIEALFFAGDSTGHQFVYPQAR